VSRCPHPPAQQPRTRASQKQQQQQQQLPGKQSESSASCKVGKEVLNRLVEKVGPEFVAYQVARVGYQLEHLKLADFFDGGTLKAHLYCVMWSHGVLLGEQNAIVNLERIVCESLLRVSGNDLGSSIIFRIEYWSSSACWVAELHTLVLV